MILKPNDKGRYEEYTFGEIECRSGYQLYGTYVILSIVLKETGICQLVYLDVYLVTRVC